MVPVVVSGVGVDYIYRITGLVALSTSGVGGNNENAKRTRTSVA